MDKYSIGRAVTANTSFPLCKGLMLSSSSGTTTVAIHPYSTPGVTFSVTLNTIAGTQIIPIQCSSIGAIGAGTVTALY